MVGLELVTRLVLLATFSNLDLNQPSALRSRFANTKAPVEKGGESNQSPPLFKGDLGGSPGFVGGLSDRYLIR